MIPGTGHIAGNDVMCGLSIGCYQCKSLVVPKPHRFLRGLQWTCDHATWGPVTLADLETWERWLVTAELPYWLTRRETPEVSNEQRAELPLA